MHATLSSTLPRLDAREDRSYLGFVAGLREFVLNEQDRFDRGLDHLFERVGEARQLDWRTLEQVEAVMRRTHLGPQRAGLEREIAQWQNRGPGRLELDPAFVVPEYARREFHLQPGGYFDDALAGAHYHWGTDVFFRGLNREDRIHRGVAALTPTPLSGPVEHVLDLACCIGQSTTALKERFAQARVTGLDPSAPMLRYAHMRAAASGIEVDFRQGLAERTGLAPHSVDLAYAMILFHEIPTAVALEVLAEMRRILRPGGCFVIHDFVASRNSTPLQLHHRDYDSKRNGEAYAAAFCACDLAQMLRDAGFSIRRIIPDGYGYMNSWWADIPS